MADGAYMMVWDSATSSWVKTVSSSGVLSVNVANQSEDMFEQVVTAGRYNQVEISFDQTDPDLIAEVTVTKTSGGDAVNSSGQAVFSTGTNTNGGIKCVTNSTVAYRPNAEIYADFSCIYSVGLANSYQRIGCYDANNGFFIGYEGTSFGVTIRKAGVDTTTPRTSFNIDKLTGDVNSKFTRNGVPEALDPTKDNLYRIRFGWLGAAPVIWEVMSPDGKWVIFHIYRHPNTVAATSINDPDLPVTLDVQKTGAGATNLTISTACWAVGTSSDLQKVSSTLTDNTLVKPVRSVLVAKMPNGSYTNIDATTGGNLKVSLEEVDGAVTVPVTGTVTVNAGTGFTSVQTEDTASVGGETGTMVLAVRNDSATTKTSADGDFSAIAVDAAGRVGITDLGGSITVDNASLTALDDTITSIGGVTLPTKMVAVGGFFGTGETRVLQLNDDGYLITESVVSNVVGHDNIASTANWFSIAGYASSSTPTAVAGGDYSRIWTTLNGAVNIADGNSSITVDGTVAATQSGTWILGANSGVDIGDVTINNASIAVTGTFWQATQPVSGTVTANLAAGTNNIGDVDVLTVPAPLSTSGNGTAATALRVTVASDSTGTVAATQSGTWNINNISGTISLPTNAATSGNQSTMITALQLLDDAIVTDDAAFTVGTTKLNMAGGYVVALGSNPDAADAGDAGAVLMNRHRIPYMLGGHPNLQSAEYITTAAQTSGGDNVLPLISAGTRYVITGVTVTASAANTVNTSVRLGFGTTGVPTQGASGADAITKVILSHPGIAPGSGVSKGHSGGIVGIGGDGEELYIVCSVPTGGSVVVQVDYYTIES